MKVENWRVHISDTIAFTDLKKMKVKSEMLL